jgi:DNA-binding SARP family transcriptional activator
MRTLAARGNVAEALTAYEHLRVMLRDELGVNPSPAVQEVYTRLLG